MFVPWQSQTGYLYTYEHYQEARKKLRQGGIFCQWIGLYQSGQREFEMIADTFASVFPETTLWWGRVSQGMIALVGSNEPLRLDGNRIEQRLALLPHADTVSREYDPYLESSTILFRLYVGSWSPAQDSVLNTDEHPRIEFQMPVTYRNHQLIRGDKLLSYFDERLSRLDSGNAQFEPADGQSLETQPTRYELQRSVMGRSSDQ